MQYKQVKWIVRNEEDRARRISRLGGDDFDHTIMEAIMNLHQGLCQYWILKEGRPVWLDVATRIGPAYIKAETDDYEPDDLLELPVLAATK